MKKRGVMGDVSLFNAVVIGENPESAYFIEGDNRLHAIDDKVAALKKEKSSTERLLPLMRDALKSLIKVSKGKVAPHLLDVDVKNLEGHPNELSEISVRIETIYRHLPHNERNKLSSLIHHAQRG